jgi:hypothetical protein
VLLELPNLKVICPGHGALVNDPRERLQSYVDHRNMRERQILEALEAGGPVTSWDIMLKLYPEIDKRLRRLGQQRPGPPEAAAGRGSHRGPAGEAEAAKRDEAAAGRGARARTGARDQAGAQV